MGRDEPIRKDFLNLKQFKWARYALLIALVVNLIFYGLFHYSAIYEFKQVGEALTNEVSQSLKIWMGEQRKIASLVTVAAPLQDWMARPDALSEKKEAIRYLRSVNSRFNQYESIRLDLLNDPDKPWKFSNSGEQLLDSRVIANGESDLEGFVENKWVDQILNGKSYYVSAIFKSEDTGKPVFYYSVPIIRNNKVHGILSFKVKMAYYTELIFKTRAISILDTSS